MVFIGRGAHAECTHGDKLRTLVDRGWNTKGDKKKEMFLPLILGTGYSSIHVSCTNGPWDVLTTTVHW